MSEWCLLAASLMAQGQIPGGQLATLLKLPDFLPDAANAGISRLCPTKTAAIGAKAFVTLPAIDRPRPEFSRVPVPDTMSMAQRPVRTEQSSSAPTEQNLNSYQEVSGIATPASSFSPASLSTPLVLPERPITGSQLYQQRLAALQVGKTYTRLPTNSFQNQWINANEQPTYEQWQELLQQEAKAMSNGQGNGRLTVLVGDSLSLWFPAELMSTDRFWLNQGISGDTTTGVLRRLSTFDQTRPDTIYVMAGINDLRRGATDAEVLNNLRQIMRQLKQTHPQAKIIVHSILPTRLSALPTDRIRRLNYAIATATQEESVFFLNLQPSFMDDNGILRRDLTTDGIHLNPQGYRTWESVMASIL